MGPLGKPGGPFLYFQQLLFRSYSSGALQKGNRPRSAGLATLDELVRALVFE